ncbi:MAG TPA: hypothetical protein VN377_03430, partial [Candidatus Thermoplasmatota archaeon]|nr:hypothetical protein [Candidatus Thermoplasmatota archaeon]
ANVYQIPPNEPKVADQIKKDFSKFNFFIVELGLNVMLARGITVPKLRLNVDLKCNTNDRTDVTAVDVAPKDQFKDIKIISGKIYLGVNELLNFVPSTSIKLLSKIIKIDLDPIPFSWTIKKCMINTSGPKNYKVSWLIYETDTVESFNPMLILKARKNVRKITAKAKGIYLQQTGLITKHNETLPSKTIRIWPT